MALRIRTANKPRLDQDGFASGFIKSIDLVEPTGSENTRPWLKWTFELTGVQGPFETTLATNTYLEPRPDGTHSRLMVMLEQLALFKPEDLPAIESGEREIDLDGLPGTMIRAKLCRREYQAKKNGGVETRYKVEVDAATLSCEDKVAADR